MKVIFHKDFYDPYTSDPAAAAGRMEAVIEVIESEVEFVTAEPAVEEDIAAVHRLDHVEFVRSRGLYSISALAAEGDASVSWKEDITIRFWASMYWH